MTNEEALKVISGVMNNYHIDSMTNQKIDEALSVAIQALKAESIKHGQWIFTPTTGRYRCSACGKADKTIPWGRPPFDYCPNCGARMDEVEE